jgi:hypothetical protein
LERIQDQPILLKQIVREILIILFTKNLLDDHAVVSLAQVKATHDCICTTIAVLDHVHGARDPLAKHYSSKQHCSWIEELIKNSITSNIHSAFEAYEEDHDGNGVVLYYCFLKDYSGAT